MTPLELEMGLSLSCALHVTENKIYKSIILPISKSKGSITKVTKLSYHLVREVSKVTAKYPKEKGTLCARR